MVDGLTRLTVFLFDAFDALGAEAAVPHPANPTVKHPAIAIHFQVPLMIRHSVS